MGLEDRGNRKDFLYHLHEELESVVDEPVNRLVPVRLQKETRGKKVSNDRLKKTEKKESYLFGDEGWQQQRKRFLSKKGERRGYKRKNTRETKKDKPDETRRAGTESSRC